MLEGVPDSVPDREGVGVKLGVFEGDSSAHPGAHASGVYTFTLCVQVGSSVVTPTDSPAPCVALHAQLSSVRRGTEGVSAHTPPSNSCAK